MICEFGLSWTTGRAGKRVGGTLAQPSWMDVERRLEAANAESGSVCLTIVNAADVGPETLEVWCDSGNFMFLLGELTEDDHIVRTFDTVDPIPASSLPMGDVWDPRSICTDFTVVKRAFREFFETGDVSRDLLA